MLFFTVALRGAARICGGRLGKRDCSVPEVREVLPCSNVLRREDAIAGDRLLRKQQTGSG